MSFSEQTEAAIAAALEKRDAAVEVRSRASVDAVAAAAANASSKESEAQRVAAFRDADGAKREALAAVDKELSIPAPEVAPKEAPPAIGAIAARKK